MTRVIEVYKLAKWVAKRVMSVAKNKSYDDLYQRLDTKEGESASGRRDINQIKCIKDGTDRLLVKDEEIRDR